MRISAVCRCDLHQISRRRPAAAVFYEQMAPP